MNETYADAFAIGDLSLKNRVFTAPMAGLTNYVFRQILSRYDPGLIFTEMISAQALVYENQKTIELIQKPPQAKDVGGFVPLAVQLSGSDPGYMARAAKIAADMGADVIDLNMGCPAPKIVKNGEGCRLMQNPDLAAWIMEAVVGAMEQYQAEKPRKTKIPVTVKFRSGWDEESINCVPFARKAQQLGISAVTVHGRTRQQFYSGKADWNRIAEVAAAVEIPVIGNGDITSPAAAVAMLQQTGCAGIMVGRAMLGNPWLIGDIAAVLKGEAPRGKPGKAEILQAAMEHLRLQAATSPRGDEMAVCAMRTHLAFYFKGMKHAAMMRQAVNHMKTIEEIEQAFVEWSQKA